MAALEAAIQNKSIHAETRSVAEYDSSVFSATPRATLFLLSGRSSPATRDWGVNSS